MTTSTLTRTPAGTLTEVRSLLLADLRASCAEAGITASSPDHLHPEAELIAITERWT